MVCRAKGRSKIAEMHVAFRVKYLLSSTDFKEWFQNQYSSLLHKLEVTLFVSTFVFRPSDACIRAVNWFWGSWRFDSFNVLNTMWILTNDVTVKKNEANTVSCPFCRSPSCSN